MNVGGGRGAVTTSLLVSKVPAIREAMPSGDFRDWPQIEAWARGIATALQPELATAARR